MKNAVNSFRDSIIRINEDIETLNKAMVNYAKEIRSTKGNVIPKPVMRKNIAERLRRVMHPPVILPSASGIDYKQNPIFLKVAEFFGVDQKEYPLAVNKLAQIIDWAAQEVGSNSISDIISKISEVGKRIQSPGYNEKPYAVLYRYTRLASMKRDLDTHNSFSNDKNKISDEKQNIEKEMKAYYI